MTVSKRLFVSGSCRWLCLLAALSVKAQNPNFPTVTLPFETAFESDQTYTPGALTTDAWWGFAGGLDAQILQDVPATEQYLSFSAPTVPGWLVLQAQSPVGEKVIWLDFLMRPAFTEDWDPAQGVTHAEVLIDDQMAVKFSKLQGNGALFALNGVGQTEGAWIQAWDGIALNTEGRAVNWLRLTLRLDYQSHTWDLYINGQPLLIDLELQDENDPDFNSFALEAAEDVSTDLDSFSAGIVNPLYPDSSNDGLPDAWLTTYGLDINLAQRHADSDRDGLSNFQEYLLGTNPILADTDGDGMDDGFENRLGTDPLNSDGFSLGTLPFTEGFETMLAGTFISGTRLWSIVGGVAEVVSNAFAPEGNQFLQHASDLPTLARFFNVSQSQNYDSVWVDMRLKVGYRENDDLAALDSYRRASAFYVGMQGYLYVLSGNAQGGGQWFVLDHDPIPQGEWARFTVHHDYETQSWALWLNGVRVADNLGFRDPVSAFSLIQFDHLNAVDDLIIDPVEPPLLDNDGDALFNAEEIIAGSDPENSDISGDGMSDKDKVLLGLSPVQFDGFITRLQPDSQGVYAWQTDFSVAEGYTPGTLHHKMNGSQQMLTYPARKPQG